MTDDDRRHEQKQQRLPPPDEAMASHDHAQSVVAITGTDDFAIDHGLVNEVDADDLDNDPLFSNAMNELRRVKETLPISEKERLEKVQVYLAHVFALSMEGKRSPARHRALLLRTKIKFRSDTPHHKQTLRAMQAELKFKPPKQSEHDWAVVLEALEDTNVDENEEAVRVFLTEPVTISGKVVRGIDKARALIKKSTKIRKEKQAERKRRAAERQGIFTQKIEAADRRPLGEIEATEYVELSKDLWISVNRGAEVLMTLRIPPESLEDWVTRYGDVP